MVTEQMLRAHRDQAMKFLMENKAQSRDGIELLVREHLGAIAGAGRPAGETITPAQVEAMYREVLNLSYMMFSLGYSLAQTAPSDK